MSTHAPDVSLTVHFSHPAGGTDPQTVVVSLGSIDAIELPNERASHAHTKTFRVLVRGAWLRVSGDADQLLTDWRERR